MSRRLARELAMKTLFAREFCEDGLDFTLNQLCEETKVSLTTKDYSNDLVQGVIANLAFIDDIIKKYAREWDIERIALVDKNIMRIALYELFFLPNIPAGVAVNEALEIAKIYSGGEAPRFINGILGKIIEDNPELFKEKGLKE